MQLLTSLAALIAGTLSAWLWKARLDGRQCIGAAPRRRSARGVQRAQRKAFHKEMAEAEYLPLIPKDELRQVSGLIADITTARGWAAPSERCWAMWRRLHTIAQSPEGGSWQCSFSEQDLATASLELLGNVIDNLFLNGALKGHQQTAGAPASQPSINFKIVTETPGPHDWLAHYSPSANAVVLLRHKWSHETMPFDPAQALGMECESFICTCKLQVLLHTIAHEMVHALVMIYFPAIDAHSKAYLPAQRHGPIFKLLNKSLFGHLSDSFKHVLRQPSPEAFDDDESWAPGPPSPRVDLLRSYESLRRAASRDDGAITPASQASPYSQLSYLPSPSSRSDVSGSHWQQYPFLSINPRVPLESPTGRQQQSPPAYHSPVPAPSLGVEAARHLPQPLPLHATPTHINAKHDLRSAPAAARAVRGAAVAPVTSTISTAAPEPPGLQHNPDSQAARHQASKTTKPVPAPAAKTPATSNRAANTSTGANRGQNSLRRPSSAAAATQSHATTPHPPASTAVRKVAGLAQGASATTPTSWPLAVQEPSTAAANRAAAAAAVKRGARPGARNARQPGPELLVTGAAVAVAVPATDTATTSTSITGTAVLTATGRALPSQRGHAQAVAASGPRGTFEQSTHSSTQPTRPASSPGKHSQPPHANTGSPAPQRRAISPGQDAAPAPARNVGLWQLQDHPELGISAWPDHNTASLGPGAVARQASQAPAKLGAAAEQGGDAARLAKLQRLKQLRSQGPSRPSALSPLPAAASGGGTLGSEESELISLLAQPQLQEPSAPMSTAAGAAAGRAGLHGQQPARSPGRKEGGGRSGSWGWEERGSHSRQQHQPALDSPLSATSDEYQTCGDITPSDVTSTDYSSAGHAPGPHPWSHLHHHPLSTQPSDLTSPSSTPASVQPAWAQHPTASDTSFTTPMSAESSAYTSAAGPDQGGPEPGALAAAVAAAVAAQQRQALHRQQGSQGQEQHGSPGRGRLLAATQAHGCSRQEAGHDAQQRMQQHSMARSPPHPGPPAVRQSPPQKVSTAAQTLDTQQLSAAEQTGPHALPEQHSRQGATSQQQQQPGSKQQGRSSGGEEAAQSERPPEAAGTAGVRKGQMAEFVRRFRQEPPTARRQEVVEDSSVPADPAPAPALEPTGDSGEEGSDAVDAAAALLLARSRSLLRQRDPVEERIQALLARFQPAAPLSRRGDDSNAQPGPAVESATATKSHWGAGGAAGPHTGQGPSTAASAAASQSLAVAAAGPLLNVSQKGAKAGTAPAGQDSSWRQRLRSLLQEVDQQAGLLPAFPAAAPHPQPATQSQGPSPPARPPGELLASALHQPHLLAPATTSASTKGIPGVLALPPAPSSMTAISAPLPPPSAPAPATQPLSAAQVSAQVREALAADLDLSAVLTKLAARFGMAQPPSPQALPLPLPSTPSTQITALQAASRAELQGQQGQPTAVPLASMPVRAAGGGRLPGEQVGQPQGGEEVQDVLAAQLGPSSPPARPHAAGSQAGGAGKSASSNSHGYAGQVGVGSSGQGKGSAGSSRQGAGETMPCEHAGEDSVELRPDGSLAASSLQGMASPSAPDAAASPRSPAPAAGGHDLGQLQPSLPASDAQATALDPAGGTTATPPERHPDAAAGQLLTPPQAPGSDGASSKPQLLVSCCSPDSPSHTTTCTAAKDQPCPAPGPAPQDPDPDTAFCTPPRAAAYRQLQLLLPGASALPSCWSPTPSSHTSPTSPPSVLHKAAGSAQPSLSPSRPQPPSPSPARPPAFQPALHDLVSSAVHGLLFEDTPGCSQSSSHAPSTRASWDGTWGGQAASPSRDGSEGWAAGWTGAAADKAAGGPLAASTGGSQEREERGAAIRHEVQEVQRHGALEVQQGSCSSLQAEQGSSPGAGEEDASYHTPDARQAAPSGSQVGTPGSQASPRPGPSLAARLRLQLDCPASPSDSNRTSVSGALILTALGAAVTDCLFAASPSSSASTPPAHDSNHPAPDCSSPTPRSCAASPPACNGSRPSSSCVREQPWGGKGEGQRHRWGEGEEEPYSRLGSPGHGRGQARALEQVEVWANKPKEQFVAQSFPNPVLEGLEQQEVAAQEGSEGAGGSPQQGRAAGQGVVQGLASRANTQVSAWRAPEVRSKAGQEEEQEEAGSGAGLVTGSLALQSLAAQPRLTQEPLNLAPLPSTQLLLRPQPSPPHCALAERSQDFGTPDACLAQPQPGTPIQLGSPVWPDAPEPGRHSSQCHSDPSVSNERKATPPQQASLEPDIDGKGQTGPNLTLSTGVSSSSSSSGVIGGSSSSSGSGISSDLVPSVQSKTSCQQHYRPRSQPLGTSGSSLAGQTLAAPACAPASHSQAPPSPLLLQPKASAAGMAAQGEGQAAAHASIEQLLVSAERLLVLSALPTLPHSPHSPGGKESLHSHEEQGGQQQRQQQDQQGWKQRPGEDQEQQQRNAAGAATELFLPEVSCPLDGPGRLLSLHTVMVPSTPASGADASASASVLPSSDWTFQPSSIPVLADSTTGTADSTDNPDCSSNSSNSSSGDHHAKSSSGCVSKSNSSSSNRSAAFCAQQVLMTPRSLTQQAAGLATAVCQVSQPPAVVAVVSEDLLHAVVLPKGLQGPPGRGAALVSAEQLLVSLQSGQQPAPAGSPCLPAAAASLQCPAEASSTTGCHRSWNESVSQWGATREVQQAPLTTQHHNPLPPSHSSDCRHSSSSSINDSNSNGGSKAAASGSTPVLHKLPCPPAPPPSVLLPGLPLHPPQRLRPDLEPDHQVWHLERQLGLSLGLETAAQAEQQVPAGAAPATATAARPSSTPPASTPVPSQSNTPEELQLSDRRPLGSQGSQGRQALQPCGQQDADDALVALLKAKLSSCMQALRTLDQQLDEDS